MFGSRRNISYENYKKLAQLLERHMLTFLKDWALYEKHIVYGDKAFLFKLECIIST